MNADLKDYKGLVISSATRPFFHRSVALRRNAYPDALRPFDRGAVISAFPRGAWERFPGGRSNDQPRF